MRIRMFPRIGIDSGLGICNQLCRLYSSVAERQSCNLKVLGSNPSGGLLKPDVFKVPVSRIFTNL